MRFYSLICLGLLTVFSCATYKIYPRKPATTMNWQVFAANPARTGEVHSSIRLPLEKLWVKQPASAVGNALIAVDSMLYFGTIDGRIYAVEMNGGKKRLHKKLSIECTCAYGSERIIIARRYRKKTLYSLNLLTNKYDWQIDAGDIASEPLVTADWIYVASLYKHIDRYRLDTGAKTWRFNTEALLHSSPALCDSILVVGSDDGTVYALDAVTGKLVWKYRTGGCIYAAPVIANDMVYVGSFDNQMYAIDLRTGQLKWKFATGGKIYPSGAASADVIVFGSNDYHVYCLNALTGRLKWKAGAKSIITTSPAISNGIVFIGSADHHYYGFDLHSGEELWKFETKGRVRTSPIIWGDYLLGASENYYLYAFKSK